MGTEKQCTSNLDLSPRVPLGCCRKRRRRISSEATNPPPISKLVDDLLMQILIRLPNPRSACRCKLVCKVWRSVISSRCFNRHFLSHRHNMNQSPIPGNPNELQSIILSCLPAMPINVGGFLRVMDCFKDLVLCGWFDLDAVNGELGRSYFICNPFTKQWIALPVAPKKPEDGYRHPMARLVCEPRMSNNHDLGDGQTFVYSEYRFRVVCIYFDSRVRAQHVDMFCSESGEWIKEAFFLDNHSRVGTRSISSCNGEVFWKYIDSIEADGRGTFAVVGINPFRLDLPPTRIDTSSFGAGYMWILSHSQGALHAISFKKEIQSFRSIIWRLEEDRKSWRKLCEGLVKNPWCCNYYPKDFFEPFLHPDNPEIVFFQCIACESSLLSCDLRREETEVFARLEKGDPAKCFVKVFKPKISYWPTTIPRYEDLRGIYDGSYGWVQSGKQLSLPQ